MKIGDREGSPRDAGGGGVESAYGWWKQCLDTMEVMGSIVVWKTEWQNCSDFKEQHQGSGRNRSPIHV